MVVAHARDTQSKPHVENQVTEAQAALMIYQLNIIAGCMVMMCIFLMTIAITLMLRDFKEQAY